MAKLEFKRCPFCMSNTLRPANQRWSFKDSVAKSANIPIIEIEMFCDTCDMRSTWRWVEND